MKKNVFFLFLLIAVLGQAQTKKIAHKSHSGSMKSFSKAYKNSLFDIDRSNFGGPGTTSIILLDSIIQINDTTAIFKTRQSNVCFPFGTSHKKLSDSDYKMVSDTLVNYELELFPYDDQKLQGFYLFGYRLSNPIERVRLRGLKD